MLSDSCKSQVQGCLQARMPSGQESLEVDSRIIPHRKARSEEIYCRRNSKVTTEIIEKIRTELYDLLANLDKIRSQLMSKAIILII